MIELLQPLAPIRASIRLAGSKSISNRLLILDHVLEQHLDFINLSDSEDTQLLQNALEQIRLSANPLIDIHHAGTDMRFLTALLSATPGSWTLTGSTRMKQRPIGELVTALRGLGANIRYLEQEGYPPLEINGRALLGGSLEIDSSTSSQFISALLLVAPVLKNGIELRLGGKTVSYPYILMTLRLMEEFGIRHIVSGNTIRVLPSVATGSASPFAIESDWSSASYWYSICALSPGAEICLEHLSEKSLQADSVLPQLFNSLGVKTEFKGRKILLSHTGARANEFTYDFTNCPDIALTLAATCFGLGIPAHLEGLGTLRIKESDRILALKTELEKLGAIVTATETTLSIAATQNTKHETRNTKHETRNTKPIIINTYNDHRMAMSFAPLTLMTHICIDDAAVVNKSYPGFWEDLKSAGFSVNLHP